MPGDGEGRESASWEPARFRRPLRHAPPHARPPWWPADAPWPPHRRPLARLLRGIGCLLVLVALLAAGGMFATMFVYHGGPGIMRAALMIALGIALLSALTGGLGVRRIAVPLADLLAASRRVQAGDLTARVREQAFGPRLLRELQGAFNTMASHLEAGEELRRQLLADVSHELRTPLAVLQGGIEAMIDGVHPADEAHLATMLEETRVLSRLVEDLRTLTLAEAGTLALHREQTDLAILVTEVAEAFRLPAQASTARLELDIADDLPLLNVDPVRIHEVLENLLANALRYAPPGSVMRVQAQPQPGRGVEFSVTDEGPGIQAELLPHIFDRFVKSDRSPGSGLGLAIARGIVEAHGGHIEAHSDAAGTRIRFDLPPGGA